MRAVWILVAIAVVGAVAWFVVGGQEGEPVVSQPAEIETPTAEEATETAEEATDAVEDAVEQVQDTVNEAADEAETAVNEAVEGVVDEANEAVENAAEKINNAVSDVLGGGDDTAATVETASVDTAPATGDVDALSTALTVDGFDPEMLKAEVAGSTMSPVQRLAAKVLIEEAEGDPSKISAVIEQLRKSLNVE
jgi:gas vesicle protein